MENKIQGPSTFDPHASQNPFSTITCNFSASYKMKRLFYQSPSVVISMNYCSSRYTEVLLIQEYSVIIHDM